MRFIFFFLQLQHNSLTRLLRVQTFNCPTLSLVLRPLHRACDSLERQQSCTSGALDQLELGQLALTVLLRCCVLNTVSR